MSIDPAVLDEYREVLGEEFTPFFVDLIDTFFSSGPEFFKAMKDALKDGDAETFTRNAHTLKANCKTFGAFEFADKAFELEKLGSENNLAKAKGKLIELEEAYQQLVIDLKELRDSL
jgi:HPt (histidine-containing phosphotransfer) domain-containing protein